MGKIYKKGAGQRRLAPASLIISKGEEIWKGKETDGGCRSLPFYKVHIFIGGKLEAKPRSHCSGGEEVRILPHEVVEVNIFFSVGEVHNAKHVFVFSRSSNCEYAVAVGVPGGYFCFCRESLFRFPDLVKLQNTFEDLAFVCPASLCNLFSVPLEAGAVEISAVQSPGMVVHVGVVV